MEFRYQIPKHIEGYLENTTEEELTRILTLMFELAIQHKLLERPKFSDERLLDDLKELLTQISVSTVSDTNRILEGITKLSEKLDRVNLVATPREYALDTFAYEQASAVAEERKVKALPAKAPESVPLTTDEDLRLEEEFLEDMIK